MKKPAPGTNFDAEYRCEEFLSFDGSTWVWGWFTSGVKPKRDERRNKWVGGKNSGTLRYTMALEALLSNSRPGGAAGGSVIITTASGGNLDRRIAVHVAIQVSTPRGWENCSNPGWKEASAQRSWMEWFINQGTVPPCGRGAYRAQVYGRFFSATLNGWETRGPIYSPTLSLPPST